MKLIAEAARAAGIRLFDRQQEKLKQYARLLLDDAVELGLSGIRTQKDVAAKHIADCMHLAAAIRNKGLSASRAADVGTGAGLPGIVLRILLDDLSEVCLIDSKSRAANWTAGVISDLCLDRISVLNARAEEVACGQNREGFDLSVSRAFGPLPVTMEYCLPLIKVGGCFVAMRGPAAERGDELERIAQLLGARIDETMRYELPWRCGSRRLIFFEKTNPTPVEYPRRGSKPRKRPLVFHVKHLYNG